MNDARKSDLAALDAVFSKALDRLTSVRARLAAAQDEFAEAVEDLDHIRMALADLKSGSDDAMVRARLRAFREHGAVVVAAAEKHGADLRDVVGPGAPRTTAGACARRVAIATLIDSGLPISDAARVLNVSFEAARQVSVKRAA